MKLYQIDAPGARRYAGTAADSRAQRAILMEQTGAARKNVAITEVEVPTKKPDLLAYLNGVCDELGDQRVSTKEEETE